MFTELPTTSIPPAASQHVPGSKRRHSALEEDFDNAEIHRPNKRQAQPATMGSHCAQLIARWTSPPESYMHKPSDFRVC
jgi:hypothetical protein